LKVYGYDSAFEFNKRLQSSLIEKKRLRQYLRKDSE
jgi:hypothetical protein